MRIDVATTQDAAVDLRMQRLHAAIEHLGETGVVGDFGDVESRVDERTRGAAGRQQPHAGLTQTARKFDEAGLVGNGQQRLGDFHATRLEEL